MSLHGTLCHAICEDQGRSLVKGMSMSSHCVLNQAHDSVPLCRFSSSLVYSILSITTVTRLAKARTSVCSCHKGVLEGSINIAVIKSVLKTSIWNTDLHMKSVELENLHRILSLGYKALKMIVIQSGPNKLNYSEAQSSVTFGEGYKTLWKTFICLLDPESI